MKKSMTAEDKAIAASTAKIEREFANRAKKRLYQINAAFWPNTDVLGMTDKEFEDWLFPKMKENNPDAYNELMAERDKKAKRAAKAKARRALKKQAENQNEDVYENEQMNG